MSLTKAKTLLMRAGAVLFGVLVVWFVLPMFFGIVNPGNIAGAVICLTAAVGLILYPGLHGKKAFRRAAEGFTMAFVVGAGYAAVLTLGMTGAALKEAPEGTEAVVILLGAETRNGAPGVMLEGRLEATLELLLENEAYMVVTTGGVGRRDTVPEAYVAAQWLISRGISADRIVMETESLNTYENITLAAAHIRERELPETLIIVSDGFHVWRGMRTAEALGFEAYSRSVATNPLLLPTYWLRELFALTRDIFLQGE